jgi:proteic killer suppression protein
MSRIPHNDMKEASYPFKECGRRPSLTKLWAILKFRHKGLKQFFLSGTTAGIQDKHAGRLRLILGRLNGALGSGDMALPGLNLHLLKGDRKGIWAVSVSGNWRITFRFSGSDVLDVDYEDYH